MPQPAIEREVRIVGEGHWLLDPSAQLPAEWPQGAVGQVVREMALATYYRSQGPAEPWPVSFYQSLVLRLSGLVRDRDEFFRLEGLAEATATQAARMQPASVPLPRVSRELYSEVGKQGGKDRRRTHR